ncbi:MAG: 16S rRNA (cytosine(1402)-N(4))-methyltransferase [Candidatus Lambdaproteobacteria bacterium RIFOXYD1_FULL_56_27]|uniref:Ribosomal RNA small subunit methyltransferase H n=1 Tax=Candidatus Lambdaproteobacteria bacterium RIFOXYD2_FULL_56_26 TaxID=1817773 RepID=A0A1F6GNZ7_9PROT|nr:MAG: 16S rRNA (cytosine(1402)-N(4))-methyltransferase [Candidatus Lambdaproteobacteria bacterium RIFOXYD2_FULL_56_26]OGH03883.1 MAG: 16S rRNA (cytosine(1402)-N(4))-methyltransferase [Candidatus Lambdaproteobacteria bacterium RIFOXYC1_FULL_56_13]OGH08929.1 MAG: 16S rRNA (cytosine(1402)-N(4))-methyltransferase [Candidatus Lambdaproteobacteria bacterium RIFOXYD1_FULL_56_27]
MTFAHRPVLVEPILALCPPKAKLYLDFTLGGGGHAGALLNKFSGLELWGSDQDPAALAAAKMTLAPFGERAKITKSDMASQASRLVEAGVKADFVLVDLGVSSAQLDQKDRGFSFSQDGPLDMRMDPEGGTSAQEYLAQVDYSELVRVLFEYGEESFAKKIASDLIQRRGKKPLETTKELAELVYQSIPRKFHPQKIHPATKTFQAIRIKINDEMGQLERFLEQAIPLLNLGGRLAMISFHSLEDRPVKQAFLAWEKPCICPPEFPVCNCGRLPLGVRVTKKPITAEPEETKANPRARSAKLRVFERT